MKNNSVESVDKVQFKSSNVNSLGFVVIVLVVVELVLVFALNLYQKSQLEKADKNIANVKSQIATNHPDLNTSVDTIIEGQSMLQQVLASRVSWDKFYTNLNAITPKDVRFTSFAINENGAFQASGETGSLSGLANALVVFTEGAGASVATPFSSVTLNNNSITSRGGKTYVTFTISGQVALSKFKGAN